MGIFDSDSGLEEKLEMMKLKNQLLSEKVSMTEKKAMIKDLKRKYGRDWKNILKLGKDSDMMRQFASAGKKMGDVGGRASTDINASKYGFAKPNTPQPSHSSPTPQSLIEGSRKSLGM